MSKSEGKIYGARASFWKKVFKRVVDVSSEGLIVEITIGAFACVEEEYIRMLRLGDKKSEANSRERPKLGIEVDSLGGKVTALARAGCLEVAYPELIDVRV